MPSIFQESVVPLCQAGACFPGHRPSLAALRVWANDGQLEVAKIGSRIFTSREAIVRFLERCNEPAAAAV